MTNFDDIRPYHDDEVEAVINRVVNDKEFRLAIARLQFPKITSIIPGIVTRVVGYYVKKEAKGIAPKSTPAFFKNFLRSNCGVPSSCFLMKR